MTNHLKLNNPNEYKFFFVESTSKCNLRCSYCYYKKDGKMASFSGSELVKSLRKFPKLIVCFLGGEPFLNPQLIEEVMDSKDWLDNKVVYGSNTNGTQFKNLNPKYLSRFAFHHLSLDGDKKTNDKFRGNGVYSEVLRNIMYLREYSDAGIIARMTVSDPDQILAVPSIPNQFDAVYWQVNNTKHLLPSNFEKKYMDNLDTIFENWKSTYLERPEFTVIPFIGMADLILKEGMEKPDLICGAGTDHFNISIDGKIFSCPESPHREGIRDLLGTIESFNPRTYALKSRCQPCDILKYCGGRCAMTDDELYCNGIKHINNLVRRYIDGLDEPGLTKLKGIIDRQRNLAFTTEVIT